MDPKEKDSIVIDLSGLTTTEMSADDITVIDFSDHLPAAGQATDTMYVSSGLDTTITLGSGLNNGILTSTISGGTYSIDPGFSWNTDTHVHIKNENQSGVIQLTGENADIKINDRSLMEVLDSIEQRLGLLKCREDLESEWDELRELGDRYRKLQQQIEEKTRMWDALKAMPKINPEDL